MFSPTAPNAQGASTRFRAADAGVVNSRERLARSVGDHLERTVIVAVTAMRVMQAAIDEIVDMVPMRYRFVSAARSVDVPGLVTFVPVFRGAAIGVCLAHLDDMLVDVTIMGMMQVAVMQIIDVIAVTDGNMPAAGAVLMWVV